MTRAAIALLVLVFVACSHSDRRKPRPIPLAPACVPSDRCDGDGVTVEPLDEAETILALIEVRDWFRVRVDGGELPANPFMDWNRLPPVRWVPNFFSTSAGWAAGVTRYPDYIQVSTIQRWRRRGLVRHEACHWYYCALLGDCDPNHLQQYLN